MLFCTIYSSKKYSHGHNIIIIRQNTAITELKPVDNLLSLTASVPWPWLNVPGMDPSGASSLGEAGASASYRFMRVTYRQLQSLVFHLHVMRYEYLGSSKAGLLPTTLTTLVTTLDNRSPSLAPVHDRAGCWLTLDYLHVAA